MKTTTFGELTINSVFAIDFDDTNLVWCNKIDESRYIVIGKNGSHYAPSNMEILVA